MEKMVHIRIECGDRCGSDKGGDMSKSEEETETNGSGRRSRSGTGKVTLGDVAKLAGVSTATVSRTFNEPEKVAEAIRDKVRNAAAELNWIANAAGRALASSRTRIVGAIIPTLDNEIFARQVSGMQEVLAQRNYTLFVGSTNYDPDEGVRQVRAMLGRGIEALAIVGESYPPELFRTLDEAGLPHVVTYGYSADSTRNCIGFDNRLAFARITQHLLDLGHRHFATIFQPVENNDRVEARLRGIRESLGGAGISLPPERMLIGASSLDYGAEGFSELMAQTQRPTAIICGNDTIALGALLAAQRLKIEVPTECSITGFDDLAISSRISPGLTTMHIDNAAIGAEAARQLLSAADRKLTSLRPMEFIPDLRLRGSTAAPVDTNE